MEVQRGEKMCVTGQGTGWKIINTWLCPLSSCGIPFPLPRPVFTPGCGSRLLNTFPSGSRLIAAAGASKKEGETFLLVMMSGKCGVRAAKPLLMICGK